MIFGFTLSSLRHQKGKRQKALAYALGIDPSQLSRIETGRKQPPRSDEFMDKLIHSLNLSAEESSVLRSCAKADRELGEFAVGATFEQLTLALQFANKLKQLTAPQIAAIAAVLAIDAKSTNAQCQSPGAGHSWRGHIMT